MPSSTSIPHLNITFDGTQDEGAVRQLLRHLFPGISHQPFSIEVLDGGLSNQLLLVRFAIESPDFPRLLIRIYNQTANCLVDRALELSCMLNLSKFRGTPVIYALLNNGISYSYVTGFTIPLHYLSMEKYARMMASELARFHSLPSEDVSVQPLQSNGPRCTESRLFRRLRNWISKLPAEFPDKEVTEKYKKCYPSISLLSSELDELERTLKCPHSPVVLCHNDLLPGNIIVSPDESSITFIDLEYCEFAPAAYDIGNHFCEFAGIEPANYSKYPSLPFQRRWIKWYLQAFGDHSAKEPVVGDGDLFNGDLNSFTAAISESTLDAWLREVNYFALVSHLTWGVWAVLRAADHNSRFDFLSYAIVRINEYLRFKRILAATFADGLVPTDFVRHD